MDKTSRDAVHKAIRILRSPEYNTTQALEVIEETVDKNEYVNKLVDFVKTSKRGVTLRFKDAYYKNMEEKGDE